MHDAAALSCGATAGSCSTVAVVRDLVGYGSATDFEGAAAPALSSTAAALRGSNGCDDSDANDTDFTTDTPAPRTTSSATTTCSGTPPPAGSASGATSVALDLQSTLSIALEKPTLSFGNVSPGDSPAPLVGPHHRHEHERCRLHPQRPPERVCARRSPTWALRHGPRHGAARPGARRRRPRRAAGRTGRRPARRHDAGAERCVRRQLADNPRVHLSAPLACIGALHGDRHLHGDRPVTGAVLLVAAPAIAVALALAATATAPPRPALTASPGRVVLDGAARAEVHVAAPRGVEVVDVALAPYALDLRGRPRLGGDARAPRWVSARPARLRVGPQGARVTLTATPPRGAAPGDRPFALVLTTRSPHRGTVAVRLRIGVLVVAHVPGKVARRLVVGPLRVRPAGRTRLLELDDPERRQRDGTARTGPGRARRASARTGRCAAASSGPPDPPAQPRALSRCGSGERYAGRRPCV